MASRALGTDLTHSREVKEVTRRALGAQFASPDDIHNMALGALAPRLLSSACLTMQRDWVQGLGAVLACPVDVQVVASGALRTDLASSVDV